MILEEGDKVLVCHRRLFPEDHQRFFTGVVEAYESGVARVTGRSWIRDQLRGTLAGKSDLRTKVVSVIAGNLLVYRLDRQVDLEQLTLTQDRDQAVKLTDGADFEMDLTDRRMGKV